MAEPTGSGTTSSNQRNRRIIGDSPAIKAMLQMIERIASSRTNVLITGESGTGKELVARMIHDMSPIQDKPFVPVNCGAIPENLIESEMFGHKKGSFTGAVSEKPGLFEVAGSGTLFLDEIGEVPLAMQVKLLRALQEKVVRKVGGTDDIRVDARIIAATNRDLEAGVRNGTFREDLFYRLNVIQIRTPSLRERKGDVRLLADFFLERYSKKAGRKMAGFEPDALRAIEAYSWPGNVRELENTLERAVTLATGAVVTAASLPSQVLAPVGLSSSVHSTDPQTGGGDTGLPVTGGGEEIRIPLPDFSKGGVDLDKVLGEVERAFLTQALEHSGGVKRKAAGLLGITFRSIRYRLKKQGLED